MHDRWSDHRVELVKRFLGASFLFGSLRAKADPTSFPSSNINAIQLLIKDAEFTHKQTGEKVRGQMWYAENNGVKSFWVYDVNTTRWTPRTDYNQRAVELR